MEKRIEKFVGKNKRYALVEYKSLKETNNRNILIIPDFGKIGDNYFDLIYYLSINGYRVACLETEDNVGSGDGDITNANIGTYESNLAHILKEKKFDFIITEKVSVFYVIEAILKLDIRPKIILMNLVENLKEQIEIGAEKVKFLNNYIVTEQLLDTWNGYVDINEIFRDIQDEEISCTIIHSKNDQLILKNEEKLKGIELKCVKYFVEDMFKNPVITLEFYHCILEVLNKYSESDLPIRVPSYMEIIEQFDNLKVM